MVYLFSFYSISVMFSLVQPTWRLSAPGPRLHGKMPLCTHIVRTLKALYPCQAEHTQVGLKDEIPSSPPHVCPEHNDVMCRAGITPGEGSEHWLSAWGTHTCLKTSQKA